MEITITMLLYLTDKQCSDICWELKQTGRLIMIEGLTPRELLKSAILAEKEHEAWN